MFGRAELLYNQHVIATSVETIKLKGNLAVCKKLECPDNH